MSDELETINKKNVDFNSYKGIEKELNELRNAWYSHIINLLNNVENKYIDMVNKYDMLFNEFIEFKYHIKKEKETFKLSSDNIHNRIYEDCLKVMNKNKEELITYINEKFESLTIIVNKTINDIKSIDNMLIDFDKRSCDIKDFVTSKNNEVERYIAEFKQTLNSNLEFFNNKIALKITEIDKDVALKIENISKQLIPVGAKVDLWNKVFFVVWSGIIGFVLYILRHELVLLWEKLR